MWRPRHIPKRPFPQETLTNREAEYFRQSQASLF
jgi:hypothetical protein